MLKEKEDAASSTVKDKSGSSEMQNMRTLEVNLYSSVREEILVAPVSIRTSPGDG